MYGKIIGKTCIHIGADIGTKEKALIEENALIPLLAIWSGAFGMEMMEMEVADISRIGSAAQSLDKAMRHSRHAAQMNLAV